MQRADQGGYGTVSERCAAKHSLRVRLQGPLRVEADLICVPGVLVLGCTPSSFFPFWLSASRKAESHVSLPLLGSLSLTLFLFLSLFFVPPVLLRKQSAPLTED